MTPTSIPFFTPTSTHFSTPTSIPFSAPTIVASTQISHVLPVSSRHKFGPATSTPTSSHVNAPSGLALGNPSSVTGPSHSIPSFPASSHGPAPPSTIAQQSSTSIIRAASTSSVPGSTEQRPTTLPENLSASTFTPSGLTFYNPLSTALAGSSAPQHPDYNSSSAVHTADHWIHTLGSTHATTGRSGIKPPRKKVPSFDGDPKGWPIFIQMFKQVMHDAVTSDAERIAHLDESLTSEIRKTIGGALLNPSLYLHALVELHKRYGNLQLISLACTSSLKRLQLLRDNDINSLQAFSANIHSVVATLRLP